MFVSLFFCLWRRRYTERKSGRERGSECCDPSAGFRSADGCPPLELSANLLPLAVELHDVLQLHACGARRLDGQLEGTRSETLSTLKPVGSLVSRLIHCYARAIHSISLFVTSQRVLPGTTDALETTWLFVAFRTSGRDNKASVLARG